MSVPDRATGKQRRKCWLKATERTVYVTLRSGIGWFLGHWSPGHGGTVRCHGTGCTICASGIGSRCFTYAFCELEDLEVLVFEFPERMRALVQQIDSTPTRGVGVQLAIRREGKASNSAIAIVITGFEARDELDIGPFVSTLGNRDHLGQQIPQSGPLVPNKIA